MKNIIYIICITTTFVIISCSENSRNKRRISQTKQVSQGTKNLDTSHSEEYCFRNETPYDNDDNMKDVEDLKFIIKGDSINGTFAWIPAEKGGMNGKISGIKKDNIIHAVYDEINSDQPFVIKITLSSDNAEITSQSESFGTYTIKKSDCK